MGRLPFMRIPLRMQGGFRFSAAAERPRISVLPAKKPSVASRFCLRPHR